MIWRHFYNGVDTLRISEDKLGKYGKNTPFIPKGLKSNKKEENGRNDNLRELYFDYFNQTDNKHMLVKA